MKLKKSNLEKINNIVTKTREVNQAIGIMETDKIKMINEALYWDRELDEFKKEMTEKYGEEATVDLKDGTISNASKKLVSKK